MNRDEILSNYLAVHSVPEFIAKKIDVHSFLTNNFSYHALRIGNSIGDNMDITIEIIILDEIAKKYNLILNTTEHAELHTRGTSEADLHALVQAAVAFANIKNNKKQYKEVLRKIGYFIRKEFFPIINQE